MNLKDIVIKLDTHEVQELLEIDIDSNADAALRFIKENILKKVKRALESK